MTLSFAFSKAVQILGRLWGIDRSASLARRDASTNDFARAAIRRLYAGNGAKVPVKTSRVRNYE